MYYFNIKAKRADESTFLPPPRETVSIRATTANQIGSMYIRRAQSRSPADAISNKLNLNLSYNSRRRHRAHAARSKPLRTWVYGNELRFQFRPSIKGLRSQPHHLYICSAPLHHHISRVRKATRGGARATSDWAIFGVYTTEWSTAPLTTDEMCRLGRGKAECATGGGKCLFKLNQLTWLFGDEQRANIKINLEIWSGWPLFEIIRIEDFFVIINVDFIW